MVSLIDVEICWSLKTVLVARCRNEEPLECLRARPGCRKDFFAVPSPDAGHRGSALASLPRLPVPPSAPSPPVAPASNALRATWAISGPFLVCRPKRLHNAAMGLHVSYAARSFTSADVADLAQCAQQKKRPLTSTPCPMTLHLQCSQTGARAWIAHSKLSNVCRAPAAISSKLLS